MKLSDWAKKQGIAYLTAYRWFKDGKLPVEAYQSESGTIIVKDDNLEQNMVSHNVVSEQSSDVMSAFIKKTVEFSKNGSTVEEFAGYILSNFTLKFNNGQDNPKYSKNKPKTEDIQRHFQQFINKKEKPKTNVFIEPESEESLDELVAKADELTAQELIDQIKVVGSQAGENITDPVVPELDDLLKAIAPSANFVNLPNIPSVKVIGEDGTTEGLISRTVDLNSTPQQINYTSSTDQAFGENATFSGITTATTAMPFGGGFTAGNLTFDGGWSSGTATVGNNAYYNALPVTTNTATFIDPSTTVFTTNNNIGSLFTAASTFKPTQKELESANKLASTEPLAPKKRGRKPFKNKAVK